MEEGIENDDQVEVMENDSPSSDSFVDDYDDSNADVSHPEETLTEQEIEDLNNELGEVESKAAEEQEEEPLAEVEAEVREQLQENFAGDELEKAVSEEMDEIFKEVWENVLDELETESAHLLMHCKLS